MANYPYICNAKHNTHSNMLSTLDTISGIILIIMATPATAIAI